MLLSMIASVTDISCLRDSPLHELLFVYLFLMRLNFILRRD